jgi:hypothetical protein
VVGKKIEPGEDNIISALFSTEVRGTGRTFVWGAGGRGPGSRGRQEWSSSGPVGDKERGLLVSETRVCVMHVLLASLGCV